SVEAPSRGARTPEELRSSPLGRRKWRSGSPDRTTQRKRGLPAAGMRVSGAEQTGTVHFIDSRPEDPPMQGLENGRGPRHVIRSGWLRRDPPMLTGLWRDVRFALRMMTKTRGLTAVALVTLALGIGANTAVYSVVDAILIRPLPYSDPERLVMVFQDLRARGGPATEWTGPANQADWKGATDVFSGVTTVRGWAASLAAGDTPEALTGEQTTFEYFDVLGARPALGRMFRQSDDVPRAPRVVMLSHALWTSRFGADPAAV